MGRVWDLSLSAAGKKNEWWEIDRDRELNWVCHKDGHKTDVHGLNGVQWTICNLSLREENWQITNYFQENFSIKLEPEIGYSRHKINLFKTCQIFKRQEYFWKGKIMYVQGFWQKNIFKEVEEGLYFENLKLCVY